MKLFIARIVFLLCPLVMLVPIWIYLLHTSEWSNFGYMKFQAKKLEAHRGEHFNVVYIGDSSGGNAMSTKGDSSSINLCLTGTFGFNGMLGYLDVIDEFITYDTIIVMNALDVPARNVIPGAYWLPLMYSNHLGNRIMSYASLTQYAKGVVWAAIGGNRQAIPKSSFVDFPISNGRTRERENTFRTIVDKRQIAQMRRLEERLIATRKPYYFFVGPSLPYSDEYLNDLYAKISAAGIKHQFNEPFLLGERTKGDAPDHVHPAFRDSTTLYYKRLVKTHTTRK